MIMITTDIIAAIMIGITNIMITMTRTMIFMKTVIISKVEKEGNDDGIDYNDNDSDDNDDGKDNNADDSDCCCRLVPFFLSFFGLFLQYVLRLVVGVDCVPSYVRCSFVSRYITLLCLHLVILLSFLHNFGSIYLVQFSC